MKAGVETEYHLLLCTSAPKPASDLKKHWSSPDYGKRVLDHVNAEVTDKPITIIERNHLKPRTSRRLESPKNRPSAAIPASYPRRETTRRRDVSGFEDLARDLAPEKKPDGRTTSISERGRRIRRTQREKEEKGEEEVLRRLHARGHARDRRLFAFELSESYFRVWWSDEISNCSMYALRRTEGGFVCGGFVSKMRSQLRSIDALYWKK
ncbi:hypothetical protein Bca101_027410 [Brassica carinata]